MVPTMPAPPDSQRRGTHRIPDAGERTLKAIVRQRLGDARPLRLIRDVESGLGHAKRIEQPLLFELKQRLSRNDLDDAAENIGRVAVIPQRSRLFGERKFCNAFGELRVVEIAVEQIELA